MAGKRVTDLDEAVDIHKALKADLFFYLSDDAKDMFGESVARELARDASVRAYRASKLVRLLRYS